MITFTLNNFTENPDFSCFIQYGKHDQDLYMHRHEDYAELVIVQKGTAMHKVNEDTFFVKKGDVFVINKDTRHGYESPVDFEICNIMYKDSLLRLLSNDTRQLMGYCALFMVEPYFSKTHVFESRLSLNMTNFMIVQDILEAMHDEYTHKALGWQDMFMASFTRLVIKLSRLYANDQHMNNDDVISIAKSIAYIESNFTESISLDDLAHMSNLSTRHFSRIFKAIFQTTPMAYMQHLRLQLACSLLKSTTLNITEICMRSGFKNVSYFNRKFKEVYQMTPKQYQLEDVR